MRNLRRAGILLARASCFALPLVPCRLVSALLALGGLLSLQAARHRAFKAGLLPFVSAGWFLAWLIRPGRESPIVLVDLMFVGPALALAALALRPRRLAEDVLIGGLVAAIAALLQGMAGIVTPAHWTGIPPWGGRVFGTLRNPNILAAYLAAVSPFAAAVRWPRPAKVLALGTLGAAILATASRGGWLAGAAALTFWVLRCRPEILPIYLCGALATLFLPGGPGERLLAALKGTDTTAYSRIAIWKAAIEAFLARPAAGWGVQRPYLAGAAHPHNFLLEILLRGGLVAAAGFLPAGASWFHAASRIGSTLIVAAAAGVVALAVFGLSDALLLHPALSGLFWLCLGLTFRGAGSLWGRHGGKG